MNERLAQPTMITAIALVTEGALVALALIIANWWGFSPWGNLRWTYDALPANLSAIAAGVLATVPMVVGLLVLDRWPGIFWPMKQSFEREIVPLFRNTTVGEFAIIALAAGFGEEIFFRGLLQAGIAQELTDLNIAYPTFVSILAASVVFGVCHWVNREYALLATLIGVYLGWLFVLTDNLLAPIVAHALYDFVALWYLVVWKNGARR